MVVGLINDETAYREEVRHLSLNLSKTKEMLVDYRKRGGPNTPPFSSTGL
jgi:hypothetical protein